MRIRKRKRLSRAESIRQALALVGEERLVRFLRSVRNGGDPLAVELCNRALDEGQALPAILLEEHWLDAGHAADGQDSGFGYRLSATELGPDRFRIEFGYLATGNAGDGGDWDVTFGSDGQVLEAVAETCWMA